MPTRPRPTRPRPARTAARIDGLLTAAEYELTRRQHAYEAAKAERRRIRRLKTAARRRDRRRAWRASAPRAARTVLRIGLVLCGAVSFSVGLVLLALGRPGSTELLGTAGAAWGLAAAVPKNPS
ncbi:hypothetical protein ACFXDJ_10315 [Streptomyces sp. NPDC059443]|uniref:hypothetical protein n=1 Tax=unclassified Streptomyces TaxID=2593676 RepID=UPI00367C9064